MPRISRRSSSNEPLRAGQEALLAGAWAKARRAFEAAGELPEALEGLGMAAWWLDDADAVFDARERAYRAYRRRRDVRGAARVAIAIADDYASFRGELAVSQGWHRRARDLLGKSRVPERGWLELGEGDLVHVAGGDPAEVRRCARAAIAIAEALGLDDLEVAARALDGAAQVAAGAIGDGMRALSGAATAALSGELDDRIAIGYACCYLLSSCERARDFDRAAQWCRRVADYERRMRSTPLLAVCRTHHAEVRLAQGDWAGAERELAAAADLFAASRPAMAADPQVRIAGLRRRQGRLDEAEAILDAIPDYPAVTLERAALALDRGDAAAAVRLADRYLRAMPGRRLDRLAALELVVRARLATGQRAAAAAALAELRDTGETTPALDGTVRLCEGLIAAAAGDLDQARRCLEDAADLLRKGGALADATRATRELELLGARPARAAADGLSTREVEVLRLVARGLSNARIGRQLHVSEFTIKRHVANILGKLDLPSRAAAAAHAAEHGLL